MNDLRTAAQQALEALERYRQMMFAEAGCRWGDGDAAITALRAALAQQAEPTGKDSLQVESVVAENATAQQQIEQTPPSDYRRGYWAGFAIGKREGRIEAEDALAQQYEPVEPVAWECKAGGLKPLTQRQYDAQTAATKRHYTRIAPPQRPPLTDATLWGMWVDSPSDVLRFARAVERAHGIKE